LARQRLARLGEIDVAREVGEGDGLANLPGFVKEWLTELAEAEAATEAFDLFAFRVSVALRYAAHAFCRDAACYTRFHFHEDKTARFFLLRSIVYL
jgi:hypothetical protein